MAIKQKGNTGFRNGDLFCFNCGGAFKMTLPKPVTQAAKEMSSFSQLHENCEKTWTEPVADANGKTEQENADWWLLNGERGTSSETMFKYLDGRDITKGRMSHPLDPDDFKRCYKLLQAVPQWKSKLYQMRHVSPVWDKLVDNWDKLTEMYERNVKEEWKNYKEIGMYEFMESLGC